MDSASRPADSSGRFSVSQESPPRPLPFLAIGEVLGPHGVEGTLRVRPLTDFPDRFVGLKRVLVGDALRPSEVEHAVVRGNTVLLKLKGVESADEAIRLRGALLRVPRAEAVPLPEGTYYYDQIIGLEVRTTSGERLGSIVDIIRTGSNDVYVIHGDGRDLLVPAIGDVVREIRLEQGVIIVEPMPGLFD